MLGKVTESQLSLRVYLMDVGAVLTRSRHSVRLARHGHLGGTSHECTAATLYRPTSQQIGPKNL